MSFIYLFIFFFNFLQIINIKQSFILYSFDSIIIQISHEMKWSELRVKKNLKQNRVGMRGWGQKKKNDEWIVMDDLLGYRMRNYLNRFIMLKNEKMMFALFIIIFIFFMNLGYCVIMSVCMCLQVEKNMVPMEIIDWV